MFPPKRGSAAPCIARRDAIAQRSHPGCTDPAGGRKPINAKCETVHDLPTFRDAYRRLRPGRDYDPAFGDAVNGSTTTGDSNATGGTIAKAVAKDSNGNEAFTCSVSTPGGGGDIELNAVVVSAGQQVNITTLTYEAPP